jgi:hypothetical protein
MDPNLNKILFASATASVNFALACLEPYRNHLRLRSSFVNPQGLPMHWHEFGDLEGPGWAANTVGGAYLLYRWGRYTGETLLQEKALGLLDHILEDGFIDSPSGMIYPYYDLAQQRFCLNYTHQDDWLCPGSLARIGGQMLEFAEELKEDTDTANQRRVRQAVDAAENLGNWLWERLPRLPNGWVPRRITIKGEAYPFAPGGGNDPIFEDSADGLYVLQLWAELTRLGKKEYRNRAIELGRVFCESGGFFGSINHDTYDEHESVAYATAFRVLCQAAKSLALDMGDAQQWMYFAYSKALTGLDHFRIGENRHGVPTQSLLWMEKSWNTAYLWENAESALAYLEAGRLQAELQLGSKSGSKLGHPAIPFGDDENRKITCIQRGVEILSAIALHHYGELGFLTEGVDWDNHVSRRHHVNGVLFGDIGYTEPLLNNLHLLAPTLFYLQQCIDIAPERIDSKESIDLASKARELALPEKPGVNGVRYLVRFYYPALETDERLQQALDFTRRSGADGALIFEASYDMDPALLTMETLQERFKRLKACAPRFRDIVQEVHINVMITLGHVGRVLPLDADCGRMELFPFQFMVDEYGTKSRSTACPLDPVFLQHIARQYHLAAECGADAVWVDDDTRYVIHDLPGMTCFCPLHIHAMESRSGRLWSLEELVEALRNDTPGSYGKNLPGLRELWFELQEESMLALARTIEQAVHEVSPHQAIGLMSVGQSFHAAEGRRTDRMLRVLAGEHRSPTNKPLIRPGSGFWSDERPLGVFDKATGCGRELDFLGSDIRAVAEVENHPYTPFGKSQQVLKLELVLDVLNGMPDLSLNVLSSMAGKGPLEPEGTDYASLVKSVRPFLDALAKAWSGKLRQGIDITDHEDTARNVNLFGKPLANWIQPRPWESLLARLGFPLGGTQGKPHWICGEVINAIPDYELGWMLREGAVLDPLAAQGLIRRGWGKRLGLKEVRCVNDAVNELLTDDPINEKYAGQILPVYNHIPPEQLFTFELDAAHGRRLSEWLNVDGERCGYAGVILEAEDQLYSAVLPWRVGLLPYSLSSSPLVLLSLTRRATWANLLEYVGGKVLPCRIVHGVNLYPMAFCSPDEREWLFVVANLAADDATGAMLVTDKCLKRKSDLLNQPRVEILSESGEWLPGNQFVDDRIAFDVEAFSVTAIRVRSNMN